MESSKDRTLNPCMKQDAVYLNYAETNVYNECSFLDLHGAVIILVVNIIGKQRATKSQQCKTQIRQKVLTSTIYHVYIHGKEYHGRHDVM